MSLDLNAAGAKVIAASGGGTSFADPAIQTIQINQAGGGAVPVTEANLEAAAGTTADASWIGTGVASLVAVLKSIALKLGVGASAQDGSGSITVGGTAQNLFGGLTPTNGYLVQNLSPAPLYISDVGAASIAGSSFILLTDQMFITPLAYRPPQGVSIFGNTSGQAFSARRW